MKEIEAENEINRSRENLVESVNERVQVDDSEFCRSSCQCSLLRVRTSDRSCSALFCTGVQMGKLEWTIRLDLAKIKIWKIFIRFGKHGDYLGML